MFQYLKNLPSESIIKAQHMVLNVHFWHKIFVDYFKFSKFKVTLSKIQRTRISTCIQRFQFWSRGFLSTYFALHLCHNYWCDVSEFDHKVSSYLRRVFDGYSSNWFWSFSFQFTQIIGLDFFLSRILLVTRISMVQTSQQTRLYVNRNSTPIFKIEVICLKKNGSFWKYTQNFLCEGFLPLLFFPWNC